MGVCSSTTLKGNMRGVTGDFLLIHSCNAVLACPDNGLACPHVLELFTMMFSIDYLCTIMDRSNKIFHVLKSDHIQSTMKTHKIRKACLMGLSN